MYFIKMSKCGTIKWNKYQCSDWTERKTRETVNYKWVTTMSYNDEKWKIQVVSDMV